MPPHATASSAPRRRTRILVTLGPASDSVPRIRALMDAGADAVRINFSHGTEPEQRQLIRNAREAARAVGREVGVVADLQGPKLRIGELAASGISLTSGAELRLDESDAPGSAARLPVQVPDLHRAARPGDPVLLGDGLVELRVERVESDAVITRVVRGGPVQSHQGIYLPHAVLRTSLLGPKDLHDLAVALDAGVDYVALSFVRDGKDVRAAREAARARGGASVGLIAKIERAAALAHLDTILDEADGLMVARGDLGIEVPLERIALEQKRLVTSAIRRGRFSIVATQMLLSMLTAPRPTRAEATDVANAVLDGADAVMLSEESAVGAFPVEAVEWMHRIARVTEPRIDRARFRPAENPGRRRPVESAVAEAAVRVAEALGAGAIAVPTHSGRTAGLVSGLRPAVPILGLSAERATLRRLALIWGVNARPAPRHLSLDALRGFAAREAARALGVAAGSPIVMTAGYPVEGRPTNLLTVAAADPGPTRTTQRPGRSGAPAARHGSA